jgi:hypothetical protein
MGKEHSFSVGKLSEINYRIACHEGDACQRLASEGAKISLFATAEIPERYRAQFKGWKSTVSESLRGLPEPGLVPSKIKGIRSDIAAWLDDDVP